MLLYAHTDSLPKALLALSERGRPAARSASNLQLQPARVRARRRQRAAASGTQRAFARWKETTGEFAMGRSEERGVHACTYVHALLMRACMLTEGMRICAVADRQQVRVCCRGCACVHAPLTGATRVQLPRNATRICNNLTTSGDGQRAAYVRLSEVVLINLVRAAVRGEGASQGAERGAGGRQGQGRRLGQRKGRRARAGAQASLRRAMPLTSNFWTS